MACMKALNSTLLLDLPFESVEENLVNFIYFHCPLKTEAKLTVAGNSSECKNIITSKFYLQSLREKIMFLQYLQGKPATFAGISLRSVSITGFSLQILQKPPLITP